MDEITRDEIIRILKEAMAEYIDEKREEFPEVKTANVQKHMIDYAYNIIKIMDERGLIDNGPEHE